MSRALPTRRGRPPAPRLSRDSGTPELVFKRAHAHTAEMLDYCLERGFITPAQHWCGIHLRWLYTIRYGAPGVRALDLTEPGGREPIHDDERWRRLREAEYHDAIAFLRAQKADQILLNCCVYNERPIFLSSHAPAATRMRELVRFQEAMVLLEKKWKRE